MSRLAWLCVLGAAFFLPFVALVPGPSIIYPGLHLWDWQRVFEYFALVGGVLALACSLLLSSDRRTYPAFVWWGWGIASLFSLCSVIGAVYPEAALLDWLWTQMLVVLALGIGVLFHQGGLRPRVWVLGCAGAAALLYVFWFYVDNADYLMSSEFSGVFPRFVGFSNVRFFSDYQAVLLFVVPVAASYFLAGSRWIWAAYCLISLLFALAFYAASRSLFFGQLIAHAVLFFVYGRSYWPFFKKIALFWLAGLIVYSIVFETISPAVKGVGSGPAPDYQIAGTVLRSDSSGRADLWLKAYRLLESSPVVGVGGRHFGCYVKDNADPAYTHSSDATGAHNVLVQLAAEWGVFVALLAAAGGLGLLFGALRAVRGQTSGRSCAPSQQLLGSIDMMMLAALLSLLAQSMVSGLLNQTVAQMLLVVFLGWGCGFAVRECGEETAVKNSRWVRPIAGALVAVLVLLSFLFFAELEALPTGNASYHLNAPTPYWAPRFWQQGWLLPLCGKI